MKKRFLVGLAAAIAIMMCFMMGGCGASDDAEAFDITTAEDSPEWVAQLDQAKDAEQLFHDGISLRIFMRAAQISPFSSKNFN